MVIATSRAAQICSFLQHLAASRARDHWFLQGICVLRVSEAPPPPLKCMIPFGTILKNSALLPPLNYPQPQNLWFS